jgi:hypothetical protein
MPCELSNDNRALSADNVGSDFDGWAVGYPPVMRWQEAVQLLSAQPGVSSTVWKPL